MRSAIHRAMAAVTVLAMLLVVPPSAAAMDSAPTSVTFTAAVNTTATRTITIDVDAGYRVSSYSVVGGFGFDWGTCSISGELFTGPGSCDVEVSFTPADAGYANGGVQITEAAVAGGADHAVLVQLLGRAFRAFRTEPTSLDFGDVPVNTTATRDITLTVDAGNRLVSAASDAEFPLADWGTCAPATFVGPGTCTLTVGFHPTALGAVTRSMTLAEQPVTGGAQGEIAVALAGNGYSTLRVDPTSIDFGDVPVYLGATTQVTLTIDAGYRLRETSNDGVPEFWASDNTCAQPVGPGTCNVVVSFFPREPGSYSTTVSFYMESLNDPDAAWRSIQIPVEGSAHTVFAADPESLDFGNVPLGTTVTKAVSVNVDWDFDVYASGTGAGFAFDPGTCSHDGQPFSGPGTCKVDVSFTAVGYGNFGGSLQFVEATGSGYHPHMIVVPLLANGAENVPPATTISATSGKSQYAFGTWTNTDVVVHLTGTDNAGGSGVARTEYSTDGGATWVRYSAPFAVGTVGDTVLQYRSIDNVGNVETAHSALIKIDKTAPTGSMTINGGAAETDSRNVTLGLTAADGTGSGISQMHVADTGSAVVFAPWEDFASTRSYTLPSGNGTKTVYAQFRDAAGNVSAVYSATIDLDYLVAPAFDFDLSSLSKTYGDAAFSVAGVPYVSTNSTGTLSFVLGEGSVGCTVTPDGTVTVTGAATGDSKCIVEASIGGDASYLPAGPISQSFNIGRATPTFTNVIVGSPTHDDTDHAASADVSGVGGVDLGEAGVSYELRTGIAPDYTYGAPTTTAPSDAGSYRVTFSYAGSADYVSAMDSSYVLTIAKADQTITFPAISARTYGDAPFIPNATADSGLAVVFATSGQCGVSRTTVHLTAAGSCMVLASQAGDANHNPARSVWQTFTIAKANPTISVAGYTVDYDGTSHAATGTATGVYGQALAGLDLRATTHTNTGTYTDTWTFTDATGNYNDASGAVDDRIAKVTLTITPNSGQSMTYGSTPAPNLGSTLSGFVSGETDGGLRAAGDLTGQASCSAGVSTTSPAATYAISCTTGSLAATNYAFAVATQSVSFAVTPATLTVTSSSKSVQYSDPVTLDYTITGYVNGETLATSGVSGTPSLATTATLMGGKVTSGPGTYKIAVSQGSLAAGNYEFTFVDGTLAVLKEDARAYYTGNGLFWGTSAGSTSASVNLTATIKDISAISGDPAYDAYAGDISHASVTFVNRDTNATLCTANVALVGSADPKVGTASCTTTLGIGSSGATQYTVGILVNGWYAGNSSAENTVIDVAAPLASYFITGGGFIAESSSAGQYAADAGSRSNFGFNVKSNKSATNLQGNVNVIFRKDGHTYQIKSTALTSLGGAPAACSKPTATSPCRAYFTSKANLHDITNPNAPVSLGGNLTLQMSMTDYGSPTKDTIGISLYNGSALLFSSNWSGTKTTEQILGGGNLAIR